MVSSMGIQYFHDIGKEEIHQRLGIVLGSEVRHGQSSQPINRWVTTITSSSFTEYEEIITLTVSKNEALNLRIMEAW